MGREVRRVPPDFDHPVHEIWPGYLMPDSLSLPPCPDCGGRGYSRRALELFDLWYGHTPFSPEDNGSVALSPDTPAVREFAERNVTRSPDFYGTGGGTVRHEATRLAALWNGCWSHHLNADDVAALVAANRLWDLTRTWSPEGRWQPKDPPVMPTPDQVNEWAIRTFGHDAINASVVVRARLRARSVPEVCDRCEGSGDVATEEQRAAHEAWQRTDPPTGDGWQLWETVSEGSPISPAFTSTGALAAWMAYNDCTVGGPMPSFEAALRFVEAAGWAPSFIGDNSGVVDGATWVGTHSNAGGAS
jgi:hypothetical protein